MELMEGNYATSMRKGGGDELADTIPLICVANVFLEEVNVGEGAAGEIN
jgi:hypothetical protein